MEEKIARQVLTAFSDSRINPAHLAWLVKLAVNNTIDKHMKEFFYYYTVFRNQDTEAQDAEWMGEKLMEALRNPDFESLSDPPPPGTRIVFADE